VKKLALLVGLSALGLLPGVVHAAEDTAAAAAHDKALNGEAQPDFGHGGQFGLRLDAVWGYRMVFRYPESPFCAEPDTAKTVDDQQAFCGHGGPWGMDAALSYAVLDGIEPYVWARFGLEGEPQTNTEPVSIVGAGVRIYTMSDAAFKIFVEPAVGLEFEGSAGNELYDPAEPGGWEPADRYDYEPEYKRDLVFHVAAGPHWDFAKYFGAYLSGGLTVGVLRYISASMELQLGVQGRLP
jgi:opacity protein-like surface antigen